MENKNLMDRYAAKPVNPNYYTTLKIDSESIEKMKYTKPEEPSSVKLLGTVDLPYSDNTKIYQCIDSSSSTGIIFGPIAEDPNTGRVMYWNNKFGEDSRMTNKDGSPYTHIPFDNRYKATAVLTHCNTLEEFKEQEFEECIKRIHERLDKQYKIQHDDIQQ